MPRAAHWYAPDLTNVLPKVMQQNPNWDQQTLDDAQHWYNHYLEAAWNADADKKAVNVINPNADIIWHVHKDTHPDYEDYCRDCFGKKVNHISVATHKPTQPELDAAQPYYQPNWPVPDAIVSCYAAVALT